MPNEAELTLLNKEETGGYLTGSLSDSGVGNISGMYTVFYRQTMCQRIPVA